MAYDTLMYASYTAVVPVDYPAVRMAYNLTCVPGTRFLRSTLSQRYSKNIGQRKGRSMRICFYFIFALYLVRGTWYKIPTYLRTYMTDCHRAG